MSLLLFLSQIASFFLQTAPIAVLCFLSIHFGRAAPAPENDLDHRRYSGSGGVPGYGVPLLDHV